ncbi:LOW QUALITY PROTEIN: hypothetical protein QTO34_014246 [Cnephaeus nilssonii]|uniref:L1 transposable element dsRBD-like domain-containing protein n=1 Tax=Cnephaeus nilssonii TaxID=3371016 RepID=A0AA40LTU3_CNENI|nr:LOW QUALITY PROTEIN: hypothetical protein QTO34_014246 [Eptesicus nilssonii]
MQARREWQEIFKVMNSKNLQPRLLYPAKLSFRIEGQTKSFTDKKKLKEFITIKPGLHEMLKGILYEEEEEKKGSRLGLRSPLIRPKPLSFSRGLMKVQQPFMRDSVKHIELTLPLTQRPQRIKLWSMQPSLAQPDIRRKLQKLEGFAGKNATKLVEIANKVFINQDNAAKKEAEEKLKRKVTLIAAAVIEASSQKRIGRQKGATSGKGRMDLKRDQCAYCKELGHWKNECLS